MEGEIGEIDFLHASIFKAAATSDEFGRVRKAFIQLSGRIRPMEGLRGFDQQFLEWLEANEINLDYDCCPALKPDGECISIKQLYCLLIAPVGCHPNCRHSLGCDRDGLAYSLVLLLMKSQFAWTRRGVSEPGAIYARMGLAKVFRSSFDRINFSDLTLI